MICPSCKLYPIDEEAGFVYSCCECAELHINDDLWHARMMKAVGL